MPPPCSDSKQDATLTTKPSSPSSANSPPRASCSASTGPRTTSNSTAAAANDSAIPPSASSTSTPLTLTPLRPTDSNYLPAGPPPAPPITPARETLTTSADQPAPQQNLL